MGLSNDLLVWINQTLGSEFSAESLLVNIGDGTILCRLLNTFRSSHPVQFVPGTPNRFQRTQNVLAFLDGCLEIGLSPLFDPTLLIRSQQDLQPLFSTLEALKKLSSSTGYQPDGQVPTSSLLQPASIPKEDPKALSELLLRSYNPPDVIEEKLSKISSVSGARALLGLSDLPHQPSQQELSTAVEILRAAQRTVFDSERHMQRLCVQCGQSYQPSQNFDQACHFHQNHLCCNDNMEETCFSRRHRSSHHSDWPYVNWTNWYDGWLGRDPTPILSLRDASSPTSINIALCEQQLLVYFNYTFMAVFDWDRLKSRALKNKQMIVERHGKNGAFISVRISSFDADRDNASLLVTLQDHESVGPSIVRIDLFSRLEKFETHFLQDRQLKFYQPLTPYQPPEDVSKGYQFPPDWLVSQATPIPDRGNLPLQVQLTAGLRQNQYWGIDLEIHHLDLKSWLLLTSVTLEFRTTPGHYQLLTPERGAAFEELLLRRLEPGETIRHRNHFITLFPGQADPTPQLNSQYALRFRLSLEDFEGRRHVSVVEVPRGSQCVVAPNSSIGSGEIAMQKYVQVDRPIEGLRAMLSLEFREETDGTVAFNCVGSGFQ